MIKTLMMQLDLGLLNLIAHYHFEGNTLEWGKDMTPEQVKAILGNFCLIR